MTTLEITSSHCENTVDGLEHMFTRSGIDYSIFVKKDCVEVWKTNNMRGSMSNDCFWNGLNNQGKPMAKFLIKAVSLITSGITVH